MTIDPLTQEPQPVTPVFPDVNAWRQLLELTLRDVKGTASTPIRSHLRLPENLVPWYRALVVVRAGVEAQIGDARARLRVVAVEEGAGTGTMSDRYLEAKAHHDGRLAGRLRFLQTVKARQDECTHLMGVHGIAPVLTAESLLTVVLRALAMLEVDNADGARGLLSAVVRAAQGAPMVVAP